VVTLGKLIQFYNTFAVGEGEATDWQRLCILSARGLIWVSNQACRIL